VLALIRSRSLELSRKYKLLKLNIISLIIDFLFAGLKRSITNHKKAPKMDVLLMVLWKQEALYIFMLRLGCCLLCAIKMSVYSTGISDYITSVFSVSRRFGIFESTHLAQLLQYRQTNKSIYLSIYHIVRSLAHPTLWKTSLAYLVKSSLLATKLTKQILLWTGMKLKIWKREWLTVFYKWIFKLTLWSRTSLYAI